ncbi:MAG: two-component system, OmpR family, sensor histidine kinase KdpD [Frankiales bacterium]|nr:two-component system, OmpR family, sensor histidine kinase KdpD [Frankiales bacterium]
MAQRIPVRRELAAVVVAAVGMPALTAVLTHTDQGYATPVLLMLLLVVVVALVGGLRPAVPASLAGGLALNYWFTPPLHQLAIANGSDLVVLLVYLAVAVAVSVVVDLAARRTAEAVRAAAEAAALSSVAGATLAERETLPAVLERVRTAFGASEVQLVEQVRGADVPVAAVGTADPDDGTTVVPAGPDARLVVRGPDLFGADRQVLQAFAEAASTALTGRRMAEVDRLRTALLAAVGHDLRTPLAGVKAAVTSLRSPEVVWSAEETAELLETIEESADRLQSLVSNLLDASRLQAGALSVVKASVGLDEVVARALVGLPEHERVAVDVPESLPAVLTDAGLLERVLANLVDNALRHSDSVEILAAPGTLAVIDHGPGMSEMPPAFGSDRGVGLGLLVVRGFVDALGGTLTPSRTEGGGLTMTVVLPA